MVYKIASIHPGTDEFRYYNSKEDAKEDVSCVRIERRPGSKGANCAIALSKKGARVDYFTVGKGAYGCDSFLSDEKIRIIRTVTSAQERINVKLIYPCGEINGMIEKNGKMDALSPDEKQRFFDSLTASAGVGDKMTERLYL
ncbi:MAG: carbohydrate kinase family protein, partial [Ruminococcaceae bacterium]|nr:carbohydrate kinase family protein [Oscillospiraceae bacterium]